MTRMREGFKYTDPRGMIDGATLVEYYISYHWLEVEIFHVEDAATVARFERRP